MPRLKAAKSSGGLATVSPFYDNRFGTFTNPSTGWIDFALKPGCRRIWCNSSGGNDANDGLSAATALATLSAAITLYTNGAYTPGDQLMFAGTGGRTYTDPGTGTTLTFTSGFSMQYPAVIQCYDPANPADSTKYGKLLGSARPHINITPGDTPQLCCFGASGTNFLFYQGLILDGQNADSANATISWNGPHIGFGWQNCTFATQVPNLGGGNPMGSDWLFSKCSSYGQWTATGNNAQGLNVGGLTNLRVQDCVFAHNGWKMGGTRDAGSASVFGHGSYVDGNQYYDANFDRCMYVDPSQDGPNFRGNVKSTCIATIDGPMFVMGGYSNNYTENPLGSLIQQTDFVASGGNNVNSTSPRNSLGFQNLRLGSFIKNGVFFDNPTYGASLITTNAGSTGEIVPMLTLDTVYEYNYAPTGPVVNFGGSIPSKGIANLVNCITTVAIVPGAQVTASGCSTWTAGTTFPNAKTQAQAIAAMGIGDGSKKALAEAMIEYPHLRWAEAYVTICLQAFGLQPKTFPPLAPPSIAGLPTPPAIYT